MFLVYHRMQILIFVIIVCYLSVKIVEQLARNRRIRLQIEMVHQVIRLNQLIRHFRISHLCLKRFFKF